MSDILNSNDEQNEEIQKWLDRIKSLNLRLQSETQSVYPYLVSRAPDTIFSDSQRPDKEDLVNKASHFIEGTFLVYFSSLFESLYSNIDRSIENRDRNTVYSFIDEVQISRLKAYLHLRHSFSHRSDGQRARMYYDEFNLNMQSDNPLQVHFNQEKDIILFNKTNISADYRQFLQDLMLNMIMNVREIFNN